MSQNNVIFHSAHWYMSDITSRIIAETGIPTDRFHLGKIILQCFKEDPSFELQIDGATGKSETFASAAERSVRCATSFRKFGLQQGDVVVIMAPNHLDVAIPFYAALYVGLPMAAVDRTLTPNELQLLFNRTSPKIIFCQSEKAQDVQLALNQLNNEALIVTFNKGNYFLSFAEFMEKYGDDTPVEKFLPTDFNSEETVAFLITTSGSTGTPKSAAVTHKNFAIAIPYSWEFRHEFPSPTRMSLLLAPMQWLTAYIMFVHGPIIRYTRLQTSEPVTKEHVCYLINTYRELSPNTLIGNSYGMTEIVGSGFRINFFASRSNGLPKSCFQYRLVNIDTQEDILEPNIAGELWLKGPTVFKEYYNDPEHTKQAFAENGWFKTGDLFYRDEQWNFYFVDRLKSLLKYKSYQISPVEIEGVIRRHPGVLDVGVSAVPDPECGDLVVACVVRMPNCDVTAQKIKDWVAESLTDSKRLRGGVIFLDALPVMANTKINRKKLQEMVLADEQRIEFI